MKKLLKAILSPFLPDAHDRPVPPHMTEEEFNTAVLVEQVGLMKRRNSAILLTRLFLCAGFVVICWDQIGGWVACLWLAFILMHSLAGLKSADDFFNTPDQAKVMSFWKLRSLQMVLVSGLSIGFAGYYFMLPQNPFEQMILLSLITTLAIGSGIMYACWLPAFWTFMPLVLLPAIIKLLIIHEASLFMASLWLILLAVLLAYFSVRLNDIFTVSIYRNLERDYLMEQLVHQRQAAELAKEAAELAIVSKTRFFAAANHDLRQPLQAMGIFISLLASQVPASAKPLVENLSKACGLVSNLVDQILILSKLDSGSIKVNPAQFNIDELLAELEAEFTPVAQAKHIALRVSSASVIISADYQLLSRIIRNLVGNAIRYTNSGTIFLRAKIARNHSLIISVADTGAGIGKDEVKNIFKEYFRGSSGYNSKEGFGLGLSIVHKITDLLGYKISLRSRKGKGSIFRIDIPLGINILPALSAKREKPSRNIVSLKGKRILFIEDDPLIRSSLVALLESWDAEIKIAEHYDAELAAETVLSKPIDLILTDFNLGPGQMTGLQAILRIRSAVGSRIPAIIMTAVPSEIVMRQYEEETEELNYSETTSNLTDLPMILQKPITLEEINRDIYKLLQTGPELKEVS
ncbi:MAG: hybrid sensor histidine kinase/response regulator [Burkholderiales bacterium]|nr:hybrid sensor histidine kinase/response regulator [Burkholderiales bacterium]